MEIDGTVLASFLDELEKIAASHGRMHVPKTRTGRRPISVDKLLKKEKDGTLYKQADAAGSPQPVRGAGADDPGAASAPRRRGDVPVKAPNYDEPEQKLGTTPYPDVGPLPVGEPLFSSSETKKPRKKGDVPSQDNMNVVDRYDQRDNATTVHGQSQHFNNIGATTSPAEHT